LGRSDAWRELTYRPLTAPWDPALELFRFAGAWAPPAGHIGAGWGAGIGDALCGALLVERAGPSALLHGPVVVAPPDAAPEAALDVAAELLAGALGDAETQGIDTLLARPQGLDRLWVRHGFIPLPEALLPAALRGRPGLGLFGWRGGTALWGAAGRGNARGRAAPPR